MRRAAKLILFAGLASLVFHPAAARAGRRREQPPAQTTAPLVGHIKDDNIVDLCGCTFARETPDGGGVTFHSLDMETAWMNLDGRDVQLRLTRRGGSRLRERIGRRYSYWFEGDGARVTLVMSVTRLCRPYGPQCETTGYRTIITATKGARKQTVRAEGQCGYL